MNGDLDLFQMLNNMIAETYQQQKKLVERYQVIEMINNIHNLALIEVSVTYMRILLKHKEIGEFLGANPTTRADIIAYKIEESTCPFNISIFSSMNVEMPEREEARIEDMWGLMNSLLEVQTQQKNIQEDVRAIDRLKSIQQKQDGPGKGIWRAMAIWGYEIVQQEGMTTVVEFDDQTSMLIESHRDKCNKAKTQDEVNFYSRVLVSNDIIIDVVDCRAYVCSGEDLPTQSYFVFRNDVTERVLT